MAANHPAVKRTSVRDKCAGFEPTKLLFERVGSLGEELEQFERWLEARCSDEDVSERESWQFRTFVLKQEQAHGRLSTGKAPNRHPTRD